MELHWVERLKNRKISLSFRHSPNEFTKTHRSKSLNLSLKEGIDKMILGARSLYFAGCGHVTISVGLQAKQRVRIDYY